MNQLALVKCGGPLLRSVQVVHRKASQTTNLVEPPNNISTLCPPLSSVASLYQAGIFTLDEGCGWTSHLLIDTAEM